MKVYDSIMYLLFSNTGVQTVLSVLPEFKCRTDVDRWLHKYQLHTFYLFPLKHGRERNDPCILCPPAGASCSYNTYVMYIPYMYIANIA